MEVLTLLSQFSLKFVIQGSAESIDLGTKCIIDKVREIYSESSLFDQKPSNCTFMMNLG